jgi:hypothetical protein
MPRWILIATLAAFAWQGYLQFSSLRGSQGVHGARGLAEVESRDSERARPSRPAASATGERSRQGDR